jgi:hypothetical protein
MALSGRALEAFSPQSWRKFEDVVKSAERAAVVVLVYC